MHPLLFAIIVFLTGFAEASLAQEVTGLRYGIGYEISESFELQTSIGVYEQGNEELLEHIGDLPNSCFNGGKITQLLSRETDSIDGIENFYQLTEYIVKNFARGLRIHCGEEWKNIDPVIEIQIDDGDWFVHTNPSTSLLRKTTSYWLQAWHEEASVWSTTQDDNGVTIVLDEDGGQLFSISVFGQSLYAIVYDDQLLVLERIRDGLLDLGYEASSSEYLDQGVGVVVAKVAEYVPGRWWSEFGSAQKLALSMLGASSRVSTELAEYEARVENGFRPNLDLESNEWVVEIIRGQLDR